MISVIMGVNKLDVYFSSAIESIINQSYKNFELIVVANGPEHSVIKDKILSDYPNVDCLRVIDTPIGQLAFALNLAVSSSKYEIIARMDADDIAKPDRLEKQLFFLQSNNLDLVGSAVDLIDENDHFLEVRRYPGKEKISKIIPFKNCFAHPSVMYKKSMLLTCRGYNAGFNSEDYDLWLRMQAHHVSWDNMPESLLSYRIHTGTTQKSYLAYAECASYSLRCFLLKKSFKNFIAFVYHTSKAFYKSMF